MNNPHAVEVDQKVSEGTFLIVCLEEHTIPVDAAEFHESLWRWNINESCLAKELSAYLMKAIS